HFDEPGTFMVSEVGAKLDTQLRLGWGPGEPPPEPEVSEPAATLAARAPATLPPEKVLTCSSAAGASPGNPPLLGPTEIAPLLYRSRPLKSRVILSTAGAGRAGMLDAVAVLEEHGSDKQGDLPKTWTLRWMDPAEVGAKPRSWSGAVPKGTPWGSSLRMAAASGGRAFFSLRAGGKYVLLRVKPAGGVETAEVNYERVPSGDVMFGSDAGEPIVWLHESSVVVWRLGEAPRIIANVGARGAGMLGQPSRDGVPVLLSFNDVALVSTLPIPAPPKAGPPLKTEARATALPPPIPPLSLDSWAVVPNVVRREASRLPMCGAKPKGHRFVFSSRQLNVRMDGGTQSVSDALYDVRVAPGEACVAAVSALLPTASRRPTIPSPISPGTVKPAPAKPAPTKPAAPGPVTFIRVDFAGKRADGGERGVPGSVRKMTCSL
ncbi:MAG TPA: hypothetical protein VK459_22270, partial [Polyangiaceae bacterium]|nr:hypothetical protein [Polyangiaceae bacterium]